MHKDTQAYLNILLQPGEATCFTRTPLGVTVSQAPQDGDLFVAINALHPARDLAPTQPWHAESRPRRADINVVSHRNFLLELDNGSLEEQHALVTSRLPVSAITFSGAKSLHFLISLETPLPDLVAYRSMAARLLKLVPEADPSCRNASRLTRLPGAVRPETGLVQRLMYVGQRVPLQVLEQRLPPAPAPFVERSPEEKKAYISPLLLWLIQEPDAVMQEKGIRGRNALFHYLGCRMQDVALPMEKRAEYVARAYANLRDQSGFDYSEACMAARVRGL